MTPDLSQELETAIQLARAAGDAVMNVRGTAEVTMKAGGEPVTAADLAANHIIVDGLKSAFPRDCVLSEELVSDPVRLKASRVWIVDPIDGTREYIDGTDDFAVQIGLAVDGVPVLGVVNQVAASRLYLAVAGGGAFLADPAKPKHRERIRVSGVDDPRGMRLTVSRFHKSRKHGALQAIVKPKQIVPAGSIGVKMGLVARGVVDLYLHPSHQTAEWDTCGPDVILREAGGAVTDFFGQPLLYNKPDPHHPQGVAASNGAIHTQILAMVEETVRGFGFAPR